MKAENPWLHRYAVLVAASTAVLFINGPAVSGNDARPLYSLGRTHLWLGPLETILMAGLAVWLSRTEERAWLRRLVWIAFGANIVLDLLGFVPEPLPPLVRVSHSLLGQLFFSTTVAITVFTSSLPSGNPEPVGNRGLLRFAALAAPGVVLLQVVLGVVFRHGFTGLLPHMLWAFAVALCLVPIMAAIYSTGRAEVQRAGLTFTVLASVQILLGFSVFIMQAVDADPVALIVATGVHAATGALTMAAAAAVAILLWRVTLSAAETSGTAQNLH